LRHYAFGLFDRVQARRPMTERGPRAEEDDGSWRARLISYPVNIVRRMYGPFIWIPPGDWSFRTLQAGDYLLYPGMLVWYALIPAVVIGLGVAGMGLVRRSTNHGLAMLWFYCVVYFAQYLSINLSYRQRDVTLPVLLAFAWLGGEWAVRQEGWTRWYAGYWLLLAAMAAGHLIVRAVIGA
jgi:hypothetical protein